MITRATCNDVVGVPSPQRSQVFKNWIEENKYLKSAVDIDHKLITDLWDQPEREYQYIAMDLISHWKPHIQRKDMVLCKYLISHKCWWDTVDGLSSNFLGTIIEKYPEFIEEEILPWASLPYIPLESPTNNPNLWLKRASVIHQLRFKGRTDTVILERVILENLGTKEFFLNKAIGWALREYSKSNKLWVKNFIAKYDTLSALSVREGSKYI